MNQISIAFAGLTDPGSLNKKNEDSIISKTFHSDGCDSGIFAVADGVGGLMNGDVASRIATGNMSVWWSDICNSHVPGQSLTDSLKTCFEKTNAAIRALSLQQGIKMATTLSALTILKNKCFIAHIGDSRIYRLRRGLLLAGFQQLTKDHSCFVNTEVGGRIIRKSVLTECLGYKDTIHPFYTSFPLCRDDIYFLCSDGAYKTITNDNLKRMIAGSSDPLSICNHIVNQAKTNNEKDNISVIALQIKQE